MLRTPAVLITVIICSTVLALGLIGVVAWLSYTGKETAAVMLIVSTLVVPVLGGIWSKVSVVERQTNGNTTRLMDAALKDKTGETP